MEVEPVTSWSQVQHSNYHIIKAVCCCFVRTDSTMVRDDSDNSFRLLPLSPLTMSPLLLPSSSAKTSPPRHSSDRQVLSSSWDTPHTVDLIRKPGESLGISIVGGSPHLC